MKIRRIVGAPEALHKRKKWIQKTLQNFQIIKGPSSYINRTLSNKRKTTKITFPKRQFVPLDELVLILYQVTDLKKKQEQTKKKA